MRRVLRWVAIGLGAIVGTLVIAIAVIHAVVGAGLRKAYRIPPAAVTVPADSATVALGRRLAAIRGCPGCHKPDLGGRVFFAQAGVGRLVAPNLTRVAAEYDDAELERAIRHGVKRDGRSVLAMPSLMFYHLTDRDLAAIVAYLRSLPRVPDTLPQTRIGPLLRVMMVIENFDPEASLIDHAAPRLPADPAGGVAYGRYLAMTSCSECHGPDLQGRPGDTPSLALAAAYSAQQFAEFMRTGTALGGRELRMMSDVARGRFAHFTDDELAALYAYLKTLAAPAQ